MRIRRHEPAFLRRWISVSDTDSSEDDEDETMVLVARLVAVVAAYRA